MLSNNRMLVLLTILHCCHVTQQTTIQDGRIFEDYFVQVEEKTILEIFKGEVAKQSVLSAETFFTTFPRVVIQMDQLQFTPRFTNLTTEMRENAIVIYLDLRNVLVYAATLNRKFRRLGNSTRIQVMIGIEEAYKTRVSDILNVIHQANTIYPNTVTSLLFYKYRPLRGKHLTRFDAEIQQVTKSMQEHPSKSLSFGIVMSEYNTNCSELATLKLDQVNYIYITLVNSDQETSDFEHCLNYQSIFMNKTGTKLGLIVDASVKFDYKSESATFEFQLTASSNLNLIKKFVNLEEHAPIILYYIHELPDHFLPNILLSKINATETWLKSEEAFSKRHLGFSMFFDSSLFNTSKLLKTAISNSPNLMIENAYMLDDHSEFQLFSFLEEAIHAINLFYETTRYIPSAQTSFISVRITIKLNLFKNWPREYERWLRTAINATIHANQLLYGTVESVVLYVQRSISDEVSFPSYDELFTKLRNDYILQHDYFPKLGSILEGWDECGMIGRAGQILQPNTPPQTVNLVVYSYSLRISSLSPDYSLKRALLDDITNCVNAVEKFKTPKLEVLHYINVYSENYNDSDNQQLFDYGNMFSALNSLIELQDINVRISPAFEPGWSPDAKYKHSGDSCNKSLLPESSMPYSLDDDIECRTYGWWVVSVDPNDTNEYIFKDKRSLAKLIYEETFPTFLPNSSNPFPDDTSKKSLLMVLLPILLVVLVAAVVSVLVILRFRANYLLEAKELRAFFEGEKDHEGNINDEPFSRKYNKELYEIPESCFKYDESNCLGSGQFGKVVHGCVSRNNEDMLVAVKMTKSSNTLNKASVNGLLSEIKILAYIGNHENVVRLVGAYTEKLRSGFVLVFLELCSLGSLAKYLHVLRKQQIAEESGSTKVGNSKTVQLKYEISQYLFQWTREIVDGMEFIASKNLVHADLASRNVLLTSSKTAKIADFGLSRRLYDYSNYVKKGEEPLPWRWLAPESLRRLEFNEKTDVWAFGVTLWELYTLGDTPYPLHVWDDHFVARLECGLTLEVPTYDDKDMHSVMLQCWKKNPEKRPTFSNLKAVFNRNDYEKVI